MDDIQRATELTKAKVLELNAALLEIACMKMATYEELKAAVLMIASDGRRMSAEIRFEVEGFKRN